MSDNIMHKRNNPCFVFLTALLFIVIIFFAVLFSFTVLQSDDYSYSAYFFDGLKGFLQLTAKHFQTINGRALVHFFLQITLALPTFLIVLIKSLVLFGTAFFSMKLSKAEKGEDMVIFMLLFYCLLLFSGVGVWKEAIMWSSGFFNYLFPALITFFALFLHKKNSKWQYVLYLLAGATVEQWGAAAVVIISIVMFFSVTNKRDLLSPMGYVPSLLALTGYGTIFLSPATLLRISTSSTPALTGKLFEFKRLSEVFFSLKAPVVPIALFFIISIISAIYKKGAFRILYTAAIPLVALVLLPVHGSCTVVLAAFLLYLPLCAAVLLVKKHVYPAAFLMGALVSVVIMLPTNTFEYRITFPCVLLIITASICMLIELGLKKWHLALVACVLTAFSVAFFTPSMTGFYKNHIVERSNLEAVKEAKKTNTLTYNIDYDKDYAMRQMFNDGFFFNNFKQLYGIEDCTVYLDSQSAEIMYLNKKPLKAKALCKDGEVYVPLRAFTKEAGGSITNGNGTNFVISDKTLTYLDGILMYTAPDGSVKYLIADDNKILDFYTLYIKIDVVREAFNVRLTIDKT